jgi:hypothetical protein
MTTSASTKWAESLSGHVGSNGAPASGPAFGRPGELPAGSGAEAPAGWSWRRSVSLENLFTPKAGRDGLLLLLLALPARFYCTAHHYFHGGHIERPPYPVWEVRLDLLMVALLISAGTLLVLSSMRGRFGAAGFVAGQFLTVAGIEGVSLVCLYLTVMAGVGTCAWLRRTPRRGRAARLFEECVWGLVGLIGSLLLGGLVPL